MDHQPGFSELEYAGKRKQTRRERFLASMEEVVPWDELLAALKPHYPDGKRGRPPIGLERMLRLYFLQQWYGLVYQDTPSGYKRLSVSTRTIDNWVGKRIIPFIRVGPRFYLYDFEAVLAAIRKHYEVEPVARS